MLSVEALPAALLPDFHDLPGCEAPASARTSEREMGVPFLRGYVGQLGWELGRMIAWSLRMVGRPVGIPVQRRALSNHLGADRPHVVAGELLNRVTFEGMGLGDLLARELQEVLESDSKPAVLPRVRAAASSIYHGLRHRPNFRNSGAQVLMYQSGPRAHLDAITGAVLEAQPSAGRVVVGGSGRQDLVTYWDIFGVFGVFDVLRTGAFVAMNLGNLRSSLRAASPTTSQIAPLAASLVRQLLHGLSASRFLARQTELGLVAADFDRGHDTSVLCAAAKAAGIPSCSFQHGIIIPSPVASNFSPIVADSICVWGEAAEGQLIAEGVPERRIAVVGNPSSQQQRSRFSLGSDGTASGSAGGVVALALSTPNEVKDRLLVAHFAALRDGFADDALSFVVKLHPARNPEHFVWVEHEFGLPLVPRNQPRNVLMGELAAVLVTNSTFGLDAASHGVPVGVIKHPDVPIGYGQGFIDYLEMPVVDTSEDLNDLVQGRHPLDHAALRRVVGDAVGDRVARFIKDQSRPRGRVAANHAV